MSKHKNVLGMFTGMDRIPLVVPHLESISETCANSNLSGLRSPLNMALL